jgi:hypothetical protein
MTIYLEQGETVHLTDSYFGVKLPGCFCPNFAYHFKAANNWPTHPDPLLDLAKLHTVSIRAQEFNPIMIDLHIDSRPDVSLKTRDQLSMEVHCKSTPRFLASQIAPLPSVPSPLWAAAPAPPTAAATMVMVAVALVIPQTAAPGTSYTNPYMLFGPPGGTLLTQPHHQLPVLTALYTLPSMQLALLPTSNLARCSLCLHWLHLTHLLLPPWLSLAITTQQMSR